MRCKYVKEIPLSSGFDLLGCDLFNECATGDALRPQALQGAFGFFLCRKRFLCDIGPAYSEGITARGAAADMEDSRCRTL